MVEWFMKNRIVFKKGKQRRFLEGVHCHLSIDEMARTCACSPRTIRDWRREKFLMDENAAKLLSEKAGVPFPQSDIRELRDAYWYTTKGATQGGYAVLRKYGRIGGDPEYRKARWRAWWEREGQFKPQPIHNDPLPVKIPKKSCDLAEFVGIMLGDGGISKYQVTITLHSENDRDYGIFVSNLIRKLFDVPVKAYKSKRFHAHDYTVSRKKLVQFCVGTLGLKMGNKVRQQVDVPYWIKNNNSYTCACLRGLIDTDGSVFSHRYRSKGKQYSYKKLSFSNASLPLVIFVYSTLMSYNIHGRITKDKRQIRIEDIEGMTRYFKHISTHNPKHLKNYLK